MTGARIFVAVAYLILGASFVASSAILINEFWTSINEFWTSEWLLLVITHSHLFFFFPVFALLALAAFYVPSVIFTHFYWNHLPYGKIRFLLGLVAVAALAAGVSWRLDAKPRAVWEVSPRALAADTGDPPECGGPGKAACRRAPILDTLANVREEGQKRVGLSKFARTCTSDPLLEPPEDMQKERYCFPAKAHLSGAACCQAQQRFGDEVARLQADPAQRSLTGTLDRYLLPFKAFFLLILIAIGVLLAVWRDRIDRHYHDLIPSMERGIIIGGIAMVLWLAMDYAYQLTANVLFGRWQSGLQLRMSLVIAPWALLLLFYFLRRLGRQGEMIGQVAGVVAAAVAVLRYEDLDDWALRLFGAGANAYSIGAMFAIVLAGFVLLLWPRRAGAAAQSTAAAET